MRRGWWIGKFVVFGVLMVGLFGWATQLLWNWIVPALFSGPDISFWQALGLLVLSKLLFWGFGGRGRWGHYGGSHWKPYWKEKYARMTPEERERLKEKMRQKWGCTWDDAQETKQEGQGETSYPKA